MHYNCIGQLLVTPCVQLQLQLQLQLMASSGANYANFRGWGDNAV